MSDEPRTPELDGLLNLLGDVIVGGIRVALPGRITEYDATKQKASVKALVKDEHVDASEKRVVQSIPEVHGVPVMMLGPPRGRITYPVAKGDLCLMIFASSSIKQWLAKGGEVDPLDVRHHDINDAIAIVGLHNYSAGGGTPAPIDAVVVHAGDGVKAKIGGPTGTEPTLMSELFKSALDALILAIKAGLVAAGNTATGGVAIGETFDTAVDAFDEAYAAAKTTKTEVK